jgi:uroporphyrinogen decarboxylase
VYTEAARRTRIDFLFIWEDMCFKNGPMISPDLFREFLLPRYKRLTKAVREAGIDLIMVDTDGDCTQLLDLFIEGGADIVMPFEVTAGMDVAAVRKAHPELGLIGGIAKSVPGRGKEAVAAELDKVASVVATGRYLPCSDHTVPPDVAYEDYVSFYRKVGDIIRS